MVVFLFLVAGIMVPPQVLVIPLYTLFNSMQLVDSYPAIILPQLALPLGLFIFKQFFDGIPRDMQEVAALDGAGNLRIYASIVLPMSRPVMTAVGIFHFILSWNYFFWPLIIESSEKMYTLPVGLATFQGTRGMEYGLLMAGVIVASIPVLIGYIVFQDQLVKGVTLQQK
jgi:ABC-type glycerol-3-phosphate transport system permease component